MGLGGEGVRGHKRTGDNLFCSKEGGKERMNDWTREHLEKHYVGKMKAVTIPMNIKMDGGQRILELSELEEILRNAGKIAQSECYCRKKFKKCIEPMDGCLAIGDVAEEGIRDGWAKEIGLEEALEAMRRTQEEGLVHMAYIFEGKEDIEQICSCCSCCCHSLGAALRFGYQGHVFRSDYIAKQDGDKCVTCGKCVERCQFGARELSEGALVFDEKKCYGCGLCITTCPSQAIEMVKRVQG